MRDELVATIIRQSQKVLRTKVTLEKEAEKLRLLNNAFALKDTEMFIVVERHLGNECDIEIVGAVHHIETKVFALTITLGISSDYCNVCRTDEADGVVLQIRSSDKISIAFMEQHNNRKTTANYFIQVFGTLDAAKAFKHGNFHF